MKAALTGVTYFVLHVLLALHVPMLHADFHAPCYGCRLFNIMHQEHPDKSKHVSTHADKRTVFVHASSKKTRTENHARIYRRTHACTHTHTHAHSHTHTRTRARELSYTYPYRSLSRAHLHTYSLLCHGVCVCVCVCV